MAVRFGRSSLRSFALTIALASMEISGLTAQTYTDLHDFDTPLLSSPQYPGLLAQGRDGNLYGTAEEGGNFGRGGVFKITPAGAYSVLVSFDSTRANPYGGLTLGTDGNFYGTTFNGGSHLVGTAFRMTPAGVVTALHDFSDAEGCNPYAPPIQGNDGNFYGTTSTGGIGYGGVYKITPAGVFTSLYVFDNIHGSYPIAPLIQAVDGNFYGTTKNGGSAAYGTIFRITPGGVLSVLYNFDLTHGATPYAPLLQGDDGNFYGTARTGGALNNGGVVFKIAPTGLLTVLHNFDATTGTTDGTLPYAGLIQCYCLNSHGNIAYYGVTSAGGANAQGRLFDIDSLGNYAGVYDFSQITGSVPFSTLRQHTSGDIYGEASAGGTATDGVIYRYKLSTQGPLGDAFVSPLPSFGKVGQTFGVLGTGLGAVTSVLFGATVSASFTVVSDSYITVTVPAGAPTDFLTLLLPGSLALHSKGKFRVVPFIRNFTPMVGPVGTEVLITGNSFAQTSKVMFGRVKAETFTVKSDNQISVIVPLGAVTSKIQVITPGGSITSATVFTVH